MLLALQCQRPSTVIDNLTATAGGGQNAIPLRGGGHRFVFVRNAGDSAVLPSLAGHEAFAREVVVINDGANALAVFPWPGDKLGGVTNASQSVPAGNVGIFLKVDNGVTQDWRGAVIS
jgi:hypothetical protein